MAVIDNCLNARVI